MAIFFLCATIALLVTDFSELQTKPTNASVWQRRLSAPFVGRALQVLWNISISKQIADPVLQLIYQRIQRIVTLRKQNLPTQDLARALKRVGDSRPHMSAPCDKRLAWKLPPPVKFRDALFPDRIPLCGVWNNGTPSRLSVPADFI
jgi:hypothetical protein